MDRPDLPPAAPRHLRRHKWRPTIDGSVFSKVPTQRHPSPAAPAVPEVPSERRSAMDLPDGSPAPAAQAAKAARSPDRNKKRVALALVVGACLALPVLLFAVVVLSLP